jgi:hypothetical protein
MEFFVQLVNFQIFGVSLIFILPFWLLSKFNKFHRGTFEILRTAWRNVRLQMAFLNHTLYEIP